MTPQELAIQLLTPKIPDYMPGQIEHDMADALKSGKITQTEFEEFWREYDRLMFQIGEGLAIMGDPRFKIVE